MEDPQRMKSNDVPRYLVDFAVMGGSQDPPHPRFVEMITA